MKAKIEEIEGKFVATLTGEMDTAAAVEAEEVLKPLYQRGATNGETLAQRVCTPDCKNGVLGVVCCALMLGCVK